MLVKYIMEQLKYVEEAVILLPVLHWVLSVSQMSDTPITWPRVWRNQIRAHALFVHKIRLCVDKETNKSYFSRDPLIWNTTKNHAILELVTVVNCDIDVYLQLC